MNRGAPGAFAQEGALDVAHRAASANRCGGRRLTRRTSNTACILLGATIWPTFEADIEGRGEVLPWIAVQENKVGLAAPPAGACSALVLTFSAVEIMSDQFALRYRISSAAGLVGLVLIAIGIKRRRAMRIAPEHTTVPPGDGLDAPAQEGMRR